jgi:hypothetical protein
VANHFRTCLPKGEQKICVSVFSVAISLKKLSWQKKQISKLHKPNRESVAKHFAKQKNYVSVFSVAIRLKKLSW